MAYSASLDLGSVTAVTGLFSYPNNPKSSDTVCQVACRGITLSLQRDGMAPAVTCSVQLGDMGQVFLDLSGQADMPPQNDSPTRMCLPPPPGGNTLAFTLNGGPGRSNHVQAPHCHGRLCIDKNGALCHTYRELSTREAWSWAEETSVRARPVAIVSATPPVAAR